MKVVRCAHCGNQAFLLEDAGVPMICCGEEMAELVAGTSDGAHEKHVPFVKIDGNVMQVFVGEVLHPMIPAHYIQWIGVEQGAKTQFVFLEPNEEPKAEFIVEPGDYAVYEFCNLHGLWKTEGKA